MKRRQKARKGKFRASYKMAKNPGQERGGLTNQGRNKEWPKELGQKSNLVQENSTVGGEGVEKSF